MNAITITIPDSAWHNVTDDGGELLGPPVTINGTDHHLGAIAVQMVDGMQLVASGDSSDEMLMALSSLADAGGAFETTTINGQPYVLFLTPFSR